MKVLRSRCALLGLVVSALAFGVVPARAAATTIALTPADVSAATGTLVHLVATARDGAGAVVAGAPVRWFSENFDILASDASTDASGNARVILRSFWGNPETVTASLGARPDACGVQDCAFTNISWESGGDGVCGGGGYALGSGGVKLAEIPVEEGMCDTIGAEESVATDDGYKALWTQRSFEGYPVMRSKAAEVDLTSPIDAGAHAGGVGVETSQSVTVDVGAAIASAYCAGASARKYELSAGPVTIKRGDETLYDGTPAPNTPFTIPGVATIVMNEQATPVVTDGGKHLREAVNAVHAKLTATGTEVIVGHVETSVGCVARSFESILSVRADAHTDSDTGPVHVALDLLGENSSGGTPPFIRQQAQYTDGRADPPGAAATAPFTCYHGTVYQLTRVAPTHGGHDAARMLGTITCTNLPAGTTQTLRFVLDVEDISYYLAQDYYAISLVNASGATLYANSALTTEGSITIAQY